MGIKIYGTCYSFRHSKFFALAQISINLVMTVFIITVFFVNPRIASAVTITIDLPENLIDADWNPVYIYPDGSSTDGAHIHFDKSGTGSLWEFQDGKGAKGSFVFATVFAETIPAPPNAWASARARAGEDQTAYAIALARAEGKLSFSIDELTYFSAPYQSHGNLNCRF